MQGDGFAGFVAADLLAHPIELGQVSRVEST
jgi:hypothetical protein